MLCCCLFGWLQDLERLRVVCFLNDLLLQPADSDLHLCTKLSDGCFSVEERESLVAFTRAMALFASACMRFWRLSKSSLLGTSVIFLYLADAMRSS